MPPAPPPKSAATGGDVAVAPIRREYVVETLTEVPEGWEDIHTDDVAVAEQLALALYGIPNPTRIAGASVYAFPTYYNIVARLTEGVITLDDMRALRGVDPKLVLSVYYDIAESALVVRLERQGSRANRLPDDGTGTITAATGLGPLRPRLLDLPGAGRSARGGTRHMARARLLTDSPEDQEVLAQVIRAFRAPGMPHSRELTQLTYADYYELVGSLADRRVRLVDLERLRASVGWAVRLVQFDVEREAIVVRVAKTARLDDRAVRRRVDGGGGGVQKGSSSSRARRRRRSLLGRLLFGGGGGGGTAAAAGDGDAAPAPHTAATAPVGGDDSDE